MDAEESTLPSRLEVNEHLRENLKQQERYHYECAREKQLPLLQLSGKSQEVELTLRWRSQRFDLVSMSHQKFRQFLDK